MTRASDRTTGEATDVKRSLRQETDIDTHVIKKGAGRRPAPQNTRQEWGDKSFRPNHRRSNRCKEKLEKSTQTEAHTHM